MRYLTPADLIVLHEALLAEFGGMRGITEAGFGRLEAVAAAPQASAFGEERYRGVAEKAGALVYALVQNHPFWDGNKRIAGAALRLFVARNGARLAADDHAVQLFTTEIARGKLRDGTMVAWVGDHIQ